jgi:hypothetical protein
VRRKLAQLLSPLISSWNPPWTISTAMVVVEPVKNHQMKVFIIKVPGPAIALPI